MSKLRNEFNTIILQAFAQVERMREKYPDDEHAIVGEDFYAGKLIDKVKAHIEECDKPKPPYAYGLNRGEAFEYGAEEFRKALMKSLEEEKEEVKPSE